MSLEQTGEHNRILVVDDMQSDRELFQAILMSAGFIVQTAADGAEALWILAREDFDMVLCDYKMPKLDGYEFLIKIKKVLQLPHLIVIIITSDETDETKVKLLEAGANDFVRKGEDTDGIIALVKVHLSAKSGQANRKTIELVCDLADKFRDPLSALRATLDVLKKKIGTDIPADQRQEFLRMTAGISQEADAMDQIAEDLKKVSLNALIKY